MNFRTMIIAVTLTFGGASAVAADWPSGTIQLVIPSSPGGGTDVMGRIFADYLQRETGSAVAVINQPTGGGAVTQEQVRTSSPDGQTLLFNHTGMLVGMETGRYDQGLDQFTVLGVAQSYPPQVYAVAADAPWETMRDFVEDARENPGRYTVGVSLGQTTHFIAGLVMMNEGIDLRLVEASAEVDKVAGIQGGHITLGNLGVGAARQFQQSGSMRVLCLIAEQPEPAYPEFETCNDQGVDVAWISPLLVFGPAGIDEDTAGQINDAIWGMGDDPRVQEALTAADSSFRPYTLDEARDLVGRESEQIRALAQHLGLAAD